MLVVTRFAVPVAEQEQFQADAVAALRALRERPGFRGGRVARATDDPDLWLVITEWDGVGSYRRALSGYDVKLHAAPLLARAVAEPSAFEVLYDESAGAPAARPSDRAADAGQVRVGEAAGPSDEAAAGPPRH